MSEVDDVIILPFGPASASVSRFKRQRVSSPLVLDVDDEHLFVSCERSFEYLVVHEDSMMSTFGGDNILDYQSAFSFT